MVATTPGTSSKSDSMHQKQPPAKVATSSPGGTGYFSAAPAARTARQARRMAANLMAMSPLSTKGSVVANRMALRRIPQPCGAAHAARIPVRRRDEARADLVREDRFAPQPRHLLVQSRDARQSPAQHDDVGIEHVDHRGERTRETLRVAAKRLRARLVAAIGASRDLGRVDALAARARMVGREPGTR